MTARIRNRIVPALFVPLVLGAIASAGCDIVTADLRSEESTSWHKTYTLDANGRVEIANVNGKIVVEPSSGNVVDVTATKKARGATPEAAKAALERATISEQASGELVKIDTKIARMEGIVFNGGNLQVEYLVKVPAGAEVRFTTTNGGIEVSDLTGRIYAETTNGGVTARNIGGPIDASTTNGGHDIELTRVPDAGAKLECTNGGIKLRLPKDAKASITASISNGGIDTGDLAIDAGGESSRRRLDGKLNGGGPRIQIEGVNGGIKLSSR
jgi:DUF4097 and DUF4098 domain-containing protein YvlB